MQIPKKIHFTWSDEYVPESFREFKRSWEIFNPDYEQQLWTDKMNRLLVEEEFPYLVERYNSYRYDIQRANVARYLVLYKFGGVFLHLDFECLKSIDELMASVECVLCESENKGSLVKNLAFIASVPNHSFIKHIIEGLINTNCTSDDCLERVHKTTGNLFLSEMYESYERKEDLRVLTSDKLFPLSKTEVQKSVQGEKSCAIKSKIKDSFAVHYYYESWLKQKSPEENFRAL